MEILQENIEQIKQLYLEKRLGSGQIGKRYGVSHTAVLNALEKAGIKRRTREEAARIPKKYEYDFNYFQNIDTPDKAYFLGWVYADGHKVTGDNVMILKINSEDGYILQLFKEHIKTNCEIKRFQPPTGKEMSSLRICGEKFAKDLESQGVFERKSLILKFPTKEQVPDHLLHHFVRGYFDGDGCISWSYGKLVNARVSICVSKDFGDGIQKLFKSIGVNSSYTHQTKIYHTVSGGRKACLKIYEWMYKDCGSLFLTRKKEKFELIKNYSTKRKNASSCYHGVYFIQQNGKFIANCEHNKKKVHIGTFLNEVDAALAYNEYLVRNEIDKTPNIIKIKQT